MRTFFAPERLETPTFTIRRYAQGDGAALNAATQSSYEHLRPWMAWATDTRSVEESEASARRFLAQHLTNVDFTMGVWSPDDTTLLGGTGFHPRGRQVEEGTAEIGMWIRGDRAGQGLGTAVLQAMLRWGFEDWPWERLDWRCDADNHASRRTAERAGMRLEGTLRGEKAEVGEGRRDTLVLGLTRLDARG